MFIHVENGVVTELIPDFIPELPNVEVQHRYSSDFVANLVHVPNDTDIQVGYVYKNGDYVPAEKEIVDENDIEVVKANKISELSDTCTQTIYNGSDVTLSDGTVEHFTLDANDQLNLSGIALKILMGSEDIYWHEDDVTAPCKKYSVEDAKIIIGVLTTFKEYNITYFRDLRIYINSLEDIDQINAIEYGFVLPDEFKSEALKNMESMMNAGVDNQ